MTHKRTVPTVTMYRDKFNHPPADVHWTRVIYMNHLDGWEIKRMGTTPYLELKRHDVCITLEKRPSYCDRGNWIAKITDHGPLWLDLCDGWPRYYFDLGNALSEIYAFLAKRSELAPKGDRTHDDETRRGSKVSRR